MLLCQVEGGMQTLQQPHENTHLHLKRRYQSSPQKHPAGKHGRGSNPSMQSSPSGQQQADQAAKQQDKNQHPAVHSSSVTASTNGYLADGHSVGHKESHSSYGIQISHIYQNREGCRERPNAVEMCRYRIPRHLPPFKLCMGLATKHLRFCFARASLV